MLKELNGRNVGVIASKSLFERLGAEASYYFMSDITRSIYKHKDTGRY